MSLLPDQEDGNEVHWEYPDNGHSHDQALSLPLKPATWTSVQTGSTLETKTQILTTHQHSWGHWYSNWWMPEILAWIVAVACLVALCIILHEYDGKPLPGWHHGITLNTIVAILSTVSKMLLMIPVAEGLSQMKWLWYGKKRNAGGENLMDFQDIDKASRGAFGSFPLLWKARYWCGICSR